MSRLVGHWLQSWFTECSSVWRSCVFSWCGSRAAAPSCYRDSHRGMTGTRGGAVERRLAICRSNLCVFVSTSRGGGELIFLCANVGPLETCKHGVEGGWIVGVWPLTQMFYSCLICCCVHARVFEQMPVFKSGFTRRPESCASLCLFQLILANK